MQEGGAAVKLNIGNCRQAGGRACSAFADKWHLLRILSSHPAFLAHPRQIMPSFPSRPPVGHHAAHGGEQERGHEADDDHARDGQPAAAAELLHQLQRGHVGLFVRQGAEAGQWL